MRRGFTLIEISLFLVLTAALFVGVAVGTSNSIFQQRYNDSVQDFAEFLRTMYSKVMNVEGVGTGMTEKAIYGRLVTFGEKCSLTGEPLRVNAQCGDGTIGERDREVVAVYAYDIIGQIGDLGSGSTLEKLKALNANVLIGSGDAFETDEYYKTGTVDSYNTRWSAKIEKEDGSGFTGSILIVRHPRSGTVYTYFANEPVEVNYTRWIKNRAISGLNGDIQDLVSKINVSENVIQNLENERKVKKANRNTLSERLNEPDLTDEERANIQEEIGRIDGDIQTVSERMANEQGTIDISRSELTGKRDEREIVRNTTTDPLASFWSTNSTPSKFSMQQIDFCINPNDNSGVGLRRDVRIANFARNASGVEIVDADIEDNKCRSNG